MADHYRRERNRSGDADGRGDHRHKPAPVGPTRVGDPDVERSERDVHRHVNAVERQPEQDRRPDDDRQAGAVADIDAQRIKVQRPTKLLTKGRALDRRGRHHRHTRR